MCRLEHWKGMLPRHGAASGVGVGDGDSECPLPKARPDENRSAVSILWLGYQRGTHGPVLAGEALFIDPLTLPSKKIVVLAPNILASPVIRLANPLGLGEKDRFTNHQAADDLIASRYALRKRLVFLDSSQEGLVVGGAVLVAKGVPRKPGRDCR